MRGTAVLILFGMLAVAALRWGVSVVATTAVVFTLTAAALTAAGWYVLTDHDPGTLMLAGAPFSVGEIPREPGCYLLGADTDADGTVDALKVGVSSSMADRVSTFQTGSPVAITDIGSWRTLDQAAYAAAPDDETRERLLDEATTNAMALEKRLHAHYEEHRLVMRGSKREWIEASPDLLAELTAMGARLDV